MGTIDNKVNKVIIHSKLSPEELLEGIKSITKYSRESNSNLPHISSENSFQTVYQDLSFNISKEDVGDLLVVLNKSKIKEFKYWEKYYRKRGEISDGLNIKYISVGKGNVLQEINSYFSKYKSRRWAEPNKMENFFYHVKNDIGMLFRSLKRNPR